MEASCDYTGNDISDNFGSTNSFKDCVQKCKTMESTHNCKTATWNSETSYCHLKNGIGDKDCSNPNNTVGRQCNLLTECEATCKLRNMLYQQRIHIEIYITFLS